MWLPSLENIQAEKARRNLREFIKLSWPILEPTTNFVTNWHIDAMAEHLQAGSDGKLDKLVIAVPPGSMKSLSTCVFWPAWDWITNPELKWIFASYGAHLSIRDSLKTRLLLTNEWYQKHYGANFKLTKLNEQLIKNDKHGFRYASSVGGVGTGERVDRAINDDLLRANDSRSEAKREAAIEHLQAMASRGIPGKHFLQVLIMQRLDELDPAGWAIGQGGWEQLILPAEFELERRAKTSLGFVDPRKEEGELLWPELFPKEKLDKLKTVLGRYKYAAEYQQRPAPAEGGIVKKDLLKFYVELPPIAYYVDSWDTAFKTGQENDYSVCTKWGVGNDGNIYLISRFKAKVEFPELKVNMLSIWRQTNSVAVLVEDKASGQSLVQEMQRTLTDPHNPAIKFKIPIRPVKVEMDKVARLNACVPTLESNVYLPQNAPWIEDYIYTLAVFPNGAHDDDVDSTSQALIFLSVRRGVSPQHINFNIMGR